MKVLSISKAEAELVLRSYDVEDEVSVHVICLTLLEHNVHVADRVAVIQNSGAVSSCLLSERPIRFHLFRLGSPLLRMFGLLRSMSRHFV